MQPTWRSRRSAHPSLQASDADLRTGAAAESLSGLWCGTAVLSVRCAYAAEVAPGTVVFLSSDHRLGSTDWTAGREGDGQNCRESRSVLCSWLESQSADRRCVPFWPCLALEPRFSIPLSAMVPGEGMKMLQSLGVLWSWRTPFSYNGSPSARWISLDLRC
jgi:hypothetical protein